MGTPQRDFRADINGLRAWGVAAVVLYHFGVPGFGGGFAGVDIFFVISGLLMTRIIVGGLCDGRFSLWKFYVGRGARIFPALAALCAALLALGWLALPSGDYRALATQALSALAFLSNVQFWREGGYFDVASHEKWLLHTWSLSVEWQFYLLFPLALLLAWRLRPGREAAFAFLCGATVLSFALCVALSASRPATAFYLLPTRAWELLAGGLLYFLPPAGLARTGAGRRALEAAGFVLIGVSIAGFDPGGAWPGWRAAVPVAGALLVLAAGRTHSAFTGNAVAQWLGTRSYSLYLWHWPLAVALVFVEAGQALPAILVALGAALVMAELSYAWVESPARGAIARVPLRTAGAALAVSALAVAVPAAMTRLNDGFPQRMPGAVELAARQAFEKRPEQASCFAMGGDRPRECRYGGERLRAIVIGDSHADAVITALAAALPTARDGILDWTHVSCPTLFGMKYVGGRIPRDQHCIGFNEWALRKLAELPPDVPVVIVNRASVYAYGHNEPWHGTADSPLVYFTRAYHRPEPAFLAEFAARLTESACRFAQSRTVYLMRPLPEMGVDVPKVVARRIARGERADVSIPMEEYRARHAMVWAAQDAARERCGVRILDPLPHLCEAGRCYGSRDGSPLYYDDDHLSERGNRRLAPMFRQVFAGD